MKATDYTHTTLIHEDYCLHSYHLDHVSMYSGYRDTEYTLVNGIMSVNGHSSYPPASWISRAASSIGLRTDAQESPSVKPVHGHCEKKQNVENYGWSLYKLYLLKIKMRPWGFPGGTVSETLCSQCREHRSDPWPGNRSHMPQLKDPACYNKDMQWRSQILSAAT